MKIYEVDENDEKTGRWSQNEHQGFIEGIRVYGKNWKLVSQHIGTRSSTQVRSHAQKYFLRETTKKEVRQQANEYFQKSILQRNVNSQRTDVGTQYGEGVTFMTPTMDNFV